MTIPPQYFAEIISTLQRGPSSAKGQELRRTSRMQVWAQIPIGVIKDRGLGQRSVSLARDISMEGIGLLSTISLPAGGQILVCLPRNDSKSLVLIAEAVFCAPVADGMQSLGCRFTEEAAPTLAHLFEHQTDDQQARLRRAVLG
ncbi:MAG: PilZ domain-containing protein [Tepidisphaeraceae bacterium]|jgi:hypothetical protein